MKGSIPIVRRPLKLSNKGILELKFDQNMQFDKQFLDKLNRSKDIKIQYISGYEEDDESAGLNILTDYTILSAKKQKLTI